LARYLNDVIVGTIVADGLGVEIDLDRLGVEIGLEGLGRVGKGFPRLDIALAAGVAIAQRVV
jgi:hypothetical protein